MALSGEMFVECSLERWVSLLLGNICEFPSLLLGMFFGMAVTANEHQKWVSLLLGGICAFPSSLLGRFFAMAVTA